MLNKQERVGGGQFAQEKLSNLKSVALAQCQQPATAARGCVQYSTGQL